MPRKQRFKPSRKPKPEVIDEMPQDQTSSVGAQEVESAEPTRQQSDYSALDRAEEGPK